MVSSIDRNADPTLETVEFGAVYQISVPRTGEPWTLYKVSDVCGVDSIDPQDVPDGWDDSFEYPMGYAHVWSRLTLSAMVAHLAHAILEVTFVPVDAEFAADSYALLYRFVWPN